MVNEISGKVVFVSMVLVLLAVGVYAYTQPIPDPGHGGNKVLISIGNFTMTLQEAIDYDFFVEGASAPTTSYTTALSGIWHSADDVYVSVDGSDMTLQEAINTTGLSASIPSSYSSNIIFGHNANEIWVSTSSGEMTLQDAINSGAFSCVPDCAGKDCGDDGCGGSCGTCASNYECQDGVCVSLCTAGDYYDWTGSCKDFCEGMGGSIVGVGITYEFPPFITASTCPYVFPSCINNHWCFVPYQDAGFRCGWAWLDASDLSLAEKGGAIECDSKQMWASKVQPGPRTSDYFCLTYTMCRCSCP